MRVYPPARSMMCSHACARSFAACDIPFPNSKRRSYFRPTFRRLVSTLARTCPPARSQLVSTCFTTLYHGLPLTFLIEGELRVKENYAAFLKFMHEYWGQRLNLERATGFWSACVDRDGKLQLDGLPYGIFAKLPSEADANIIGSTQPLTLMRMST